MIEPQRLQTPFTEQNIQIDPATPSQQIIQPWIQRTWAMMFGRRDNVMQPIYANKAGQLAVMMPCLEGWTLSYNAAASAGWQDMGSVMDLVFVMGYNTSVGLPYMTFGLETGVARHVVFPSAIGMGWDGFNAVNLLHVTLFAKARWYCGTNMFVGSGHVIGYTAPTV